MADTPEGKVVKEIQKFLKKHEGDHYKVHGNSYQRKGEPDLTGSIKWGSHWFHYKLEVKAPVGESSRELDPLQEHRLRNWNKCAKVVGVVRSVEDVINIFRGYHIYIYDNNTQKIKRTLIECLAEVGIENEYRIYSEHWEG